MFRGAVVPCVVLLVVVVGVGPSLAAPPNPHSLAIEDLTVLQDRNESTLGHRWSRSISSLAPNTSCSSQLFECTSGKCIPKQWQCDGDHDCGENDASDEANCSNKTCSTTEMACGSGSCVPKIWVCDGEADCKDGTDERNCTHGNKTCGEDEYTCKGGHHCIRRDWLCDGNKDCREGDDEGQEMCRRQCPEGMFVCGDQSCIIESLRCNGIPECADGLDEKDCSPTCDEKSEFNCGERCIPMYLVCNGNDDCGNSKDEPNDGTCGNNECDDDNGNCSQTCVDTRTGHYCQCDVGFTLMNGTHCEDIDECLEPGVCSQVCHNLVGGFQCECVPGYAPDPHNHTRCLATEGHAALILANFTNIQKISLHSQEITVVVNETKKAAVLDFVFKTGMIFWSDVIDKRIYKAPIDEGNNKVIVIDNALVEGLAVDWLYNHIYWTNQEIDAIEVADFNGDMRKSLIKSELDQPRGIAVNPSEGWLFWSDWGQQAKIERAGMDGRLREPIVTREIVWPNALTLDLVLRKVFWCDAKLHSIYSVDFDGSNRRTVLHSTEYLPHPFSITLFEDTLYWTDWRREAILRANKFTGKNISVVHSQASQSFMGVQVYHSYRQPSGTNQCTPSNGLCTHLCLPAPQTNETTRNVSCACPDGLLLMPDGVTCESEGDSRPDLVSHPTTPAPTTVPTPAPTPAPTQRHTTPAEGDDSNQTREESVVVGKNYLDEINNRIDAINETVYRWRNEMNEKRMNDTQHIMEKLEALQNAAAVHHQRPDAADLYGKHNDTLHSLCDGHKVLHGSEGVLVVTTQGDEYTNNMACSWRVMLPEGTRPVFHFDYFDIEECNPCSKCDYMYIHDPNHPVINYYCGDNPPDGSFLAVMNNVFQVRFTSDAYGTGKGFSLRYRAVERD